MRAADADIPYGTLDLMVLKTLAAMGPLHGYGIARRIEHVAQGMLALNQGTIYPALLRLGQKGTVVAGAREACTVGRCGKRDGVRLRRSGCPAEVRLVSISRGIHSPSLSPQTGRLFETRSRWFEIARTALASRCAPIALERFQIVAGAIENLADAIQISRVPAGSACGLPYRFH